jgi:hypothetical protein
MQAMNLFGIRWVIAEIWRGVDVPLEELRGRVGPVPGWEMLSRMPETMAMPMVPLAIRIGGGEGCTILVHREYSLRLPLYEKKVSEFGMYFFEFRYNFLAARPQI